MIIGDFVINWRNDIDTNMEIEYNGKFYDITRIDVFEGYKEDLQIFAKLAKNKN
ncbi:MAG: phage head closure protein [Firmicutes bacterium]|nr:phage head closure protein [Bacillota bacterium]